jgi:hypothetical protein
MTDLLIGRLHSESTLIHKVLWNKYTAELQECQVPKPEDRQFKISTVGVSDRANVGIAL